MLRDEVELPDTDAYYSDATLEKFQAMVEERAREHAMTSAGIAGMYLTQVAVLLPFLLWAAHFRTQHLKETLAFRPFAVRKLALWLAVLVGFVVIETSVTAALEVPAAEFMEAISGSRSLGLGLVIVLLAPFVEEMIFRGYLFKAWRYSRLGLSGTLILTSLLFVALHWGQYHWIHVVFLFSLSVILGLAREYTGSLWVPIILHGANNLLPAVVVVYLGLL
jgi:membrane protease YdiL (CAAX protease family)